MIDIVKRILIKEWMEVNFFLIYRKIIIQAVVLPAIFAPIKAFHLVIDLTHEFYIQVSALTGW